MPDTTSREERLAEVTRLSRKPMQQLHANLLDVVLTAMDGLKQEDWASLAKRAPDRIIQGLAMTAKMAGYGDKLEHEVRGSLDFYERIANASDAELHAELARLNAELAPGVWSRVVNVLPLTIAQQLRALPDDTRRQVYTALARGFAGPREPWRLEE